ncbi:hypothetical protein BBJ28_00012538 [Nothophytophthora sp. Chile5]|nr:hypothetical protein BBJ28_00012538 [Nothophytophthora sp. Chile5]
MDGEPRRSSRSNTGRPEYVSPSRVARIGVPSPRSFVGSTAEAVATARRADLGSGGSILPALTPPLAQHGLSMTARSSWTTPRAPADDFEDDFHPTSSEAFAPPPRRAEAASIAAGRHTAPEGLFVSETEQAQLAYMEQMYGTIQLLSTELENERRGRAPSRPLSSQPTALEYLPYDEDAQAPLSDPNESSTGFIVSPTPVAPSYSPRTLRAMSPSPTAPSPQQLQAARPPGSPRPTAGAKDQDQEICSTLSKNAELRIRSRDMERTADKAILELELARKQLKMAERRAASREEKLHALIKEKMNGQKELKATRGQIVEEKMRQVDLFRELEGAKRSFAAELEAVDHELRATQEENTGLRSHVAELKAQKSSQARKMEDSARQAMEEKERFVAIIEDTRHRFHEWKQGEAAALEEAHEQVVRNLMSEYELKLGRHQEEKQKLREKVKDLEVSLRLVQKDHSLSPLELTLRKATILNSKDASGTTEAETIEVHSRIQELERLLTHSQEYQERQDKIIQVSEATISRLMQEREITALENLSLHPLDMETQRPSPSRNQIAGKTSEPSSFRAAKVRTHTPRRVDLEAAIADAPAPSTKPTAMNRPTLSSKEQELKDELARVREELAEMKTKATLPSVLSAEKEETEGSKPTVELEGPKTVPTGDLMTEAEIGEESPVSRSEEKVTSAHEAVAGSTAENNEEGEPRAQNRAAGAKDAEGTRENEQTTKAEDDTQTDERSGDAPANKSLSVDTTTPQEVCEEPIAGDPGTSDGVPHVEEEHAAATSEIDEDLKGVSENAASPSVLVNAPEELEENGAPSIQGEVACESDELQEAESHERTREADAPAIKDLLDEPQANVETPDAKDETEGRLLGTANVGTISTEDESRLDGEELAASTASEPSGSKDATLVPPDLAASGDGNPEDKDVDSREELTDASEEVESGVQEKVNEMLAAVSDAKLKATDEGVSAAGESASGAPIDASSDEPNVALGPPRDGDEKESESNHVLILGALPIEAEALAAVHFIVETLSLEATMEAPESKDSEDAVVSCKGLKEQDDSINTGDDLSAQNPVELADGVESEEACEAAGEIEAQEKLAFDLESVEDTGSHQATAGSVTGESTAQEESLASHSEIQLVAEALVSAAEEAAILAVRTNRTVVDAPVELFEDVQDACADLVQLEDPSEALESSSPTSDPVLSTNVGDDGPTPVDNLGRSPEQETAEVLSSTDQPQTQEALVVEPELDLTSPSSEGLTQELENAEVSVSLAVAEAFVASIATLAMALVAPDQQTRDDSADPAPESTIPDNEQPERSADSPNSVPMLGGGSWINEEAASPHSVGDSTESDCVPSAVDTTPAFDGEKSAASEQENDTLPASDVVDDIDLALDTLNDAAEEQQITTDTAMLVPDSGLAQILPEQELAGENEALSSVVKALAEAFVGEITSSFDITSPQDAAEASVIGPTIETEEKGDYSLQNAELTADKVSELLSSAVAIEEAPVHIPDESELFPSDRASGGADEAADLNPAIAIAKTARTLVDAIESHALSTVVELHAAPLDSTADTEVDCSLPEDQNVQTEDAAELSGECESADGDAKSNRLPEEEPRATPALDVSQLAHEFVGSVEGEVLAALGSRQAESAQVATVEVADSLESKTLTESVREGSSKEAIASEIAGLFGSQAIAAVLFRLSQSNDSTEVESEVAGAAAEAVADFDVEPSDGGEASQSPESLQSETELSADCALATDNAIAECGAVLGVLVETVGHSDPESRDVVEEPRALDGNESTASAAVAEEGAAVVEEVDEGHGGEEDVGAISTAPVGPDPVSREKTDVVEVAHDSSAPSASEDARSVERADLNLVEDGQLVAVTQWTEATGVDVTEAGAGGDMSVEREGDIIESVLTEILDNVEFCRDNDSALDTTDIKHSTGPEPILANCKDSAVPDLIHDENAADGSYSPAAANDSSPSGIPPATEPSPLTEEAVLDLLVEGIEESTPVHGAEVPSKKILDPAEETERAVQVVVSELVVAVTSDESPARSEEEHSVPSSLAEDSAIPEAELVLADLCASVERMLASRTETRSVHVGLSTDANEGAVPDTTATSATPAEEPPLVEAPLPSPVQSALPPLSSRRRPSILDRQAPFNAKEAAENAARRCSVKRRISRRAVSEMTRFVTDMSRFVGDPTLLAYDARHDHSQPFALLDDGILSIDPEGRHIRLNDLDQAAEGEGEVVGKRRTVLQEAHSKNLALRLIPAFNYVPVRIQFQWSDFVVAMPVSRANSSIPGPTDGVLLSKSPVEPMRLLQKKGSKLPCGTYVIVSAFIRPLEDGNENLRVQIYDAERVEEFQFDFFEEHMRKYLLEASGLEAQALEFLSHLEFRREQGSVIIKLPEKKAADDKKDVVTDRHSSEHTMVADGEPRRLGSPHARQKLNGYRHHRPGSSPQISRNLRQSQPQAEQRSTPRLLEVPAEGPSSAAPSVDPA